MIKKFRKGAGGALLDEYEKVIHDLQQVIDDISEVELSSIIDPGTADINCGSIQTVLTHVVQSGYTYAVYIRRLGGYKNEPPVNRIHFTASDYQKDLDAVFNFTVDSFKNIDDETIDSFDNTKEIITSWGQIYNIEQITEHAIVHILRHRRQIEKFKIAMR